MRYWHPPVAGRRVRRPAASRNGLAIGGRSFAPSTGQVALLGLSGAVVPWATAPFFMSAPLLDRPATVSTAGVTNRKRSRSCAERN